MNRLTRPLNIMELEHPYKYYIDCPIDVYPSTEVRRIEIPRELARYITQLERDIIRLQNSVEVSI